MTKKGLSIFWGTLATVTFLMLFLHTSFSQLRCDSDPKDAATQFLKDFEFAQRKGDLREFYDRWIISRSGSSFDDFMRTVEEIHRNVGAPRVGFEPPRLVEWRRTRENVTATFVAFYSGGQVEQRIVIECVGSFWKVVGLQVGPPRR